jgi:anaerobic sulfite reductase subunit B
LSVAAGNGGGRADPMLPVSYTVLEKRQELDDTWTLVLEPVAESAGARFEPGQFSMLHPFGAGEVPISVSGIEGERLTQTVRAVGEATRAVCACEPGQQLGVRGPFGTTWPVTEARGGDLLIVAGGLGLAPLRPAIRAALAEREAFGRVAVLCGARTPEAMLYPGELESWQRARIQVETTVDAASGDWRGRVGLVTKLIPLAEVDPAATTALLCGPEVMMRFVAVALRERGIEAQRVHVSLERNMQCAVGHCGHCQLGPEFVCKDGAVFRLADVESLMAVREL